MNDNFKNYRFEDLEVWKLGMKIVGEIYRIIKKFPSEEKHVLSNQIRRAGVSIVLNIAEGSGQSTKKNFSLYLNRSKSSCLECVACLKIALQENFIDNEDVKNLDELLKEEYFKIIALDKSLKKEV